MRKRRPHIVLSDLRGVAQLATQATRGVTAVAEGVHQSVWHTLGAANARAPGRTRGLTGLVYRSIHGLTDLVGRGVDAALATADARAARDDESGSESARRAALVAVLNGVLGDHLVASGNPLATPMSLRHRGRPLADASLPAAADARSRVLLFVHGLCMNDRQWRRRHEGGIVDPAAALAATFDATPLHLRYNTGLHISQNGRELAAQLEQLLAQWPVAIEDIGIVAHSMGGLVARSACHYAEVESMQWRQRIRHIVFLGTPHHGAPLERAGQWVDSLLGRSLYTAPFAKLGQMRSAGITDLRHGHVRDEDWQHADRFARADDQRVHLPLPADVACYSIAATLAARRSTLAERLVGDGLVPLRSALGEHDDHQRDFGLRAHPHWISHRTGHIELLHRPEVWAQVQHWLQQRQGNRGTQPSGRDEG